MTTAAGPTPLLVPAPPPRRPPAATPTGRSVLAGLPLLAAASVTLAAPTTGHLLPAGLGLAGLALLAGGLRRGGRGRGGPDPRAAYLADLRRLRGRVLALAAEQHAAGRRRHPDPAALWATVTARAPATRQRTDPDFGRVRVGLGRVPPAVPLRPPEGRARDWDPVGADALRRFLAGHRFVRDQPVTLPLAEPGYHRVRGGRRADRLGLGRAAVAQLAVFHSPDDIRILVAAAPDRRGDWEWTKWLPHARHPSRRDAAGPVRLVTDTATAALALLDQLPPPVVLVTDGVTVDPDATAVLALDPAPDEPGRASIRSASIAQPDRLRPDRLSVAEAEALARRLARHRYGPPPDAGSSWGDLLGVSDPTRWRPPAVGATGRDRLRTPIGEEADRTPVWLDLKEPAEGGIGPHGLLVGATGSGKSELLRTLLLGLVVRHTSAELNLVLIDFKGGASFDAFAGLRHTAAVVTNLAAELPLVDRLAETLRAELVRRQELLRRSGGPHHSGYRRRDDPSLPALPSLLLVCDEFSELLAARPELVELFLHIGRVGRSLGVHLLVASQRLEEGRLRGLETHLSYRICLRTLSALESRAVLGVADAHHLPPEPGHGFLATGGERRRFRAAHVSSPADPEPDSADRPAVPFSTRPAPFPEAAGPATPPPEPPTPLRLLVDRLAGHGQPAHRVWLPPLRRSPTLAQLLPDRPPVAPPPDPDPLAVPVGLVDRPAEQCQPVLRLSLARHVGIAGAPRSGKSHLLATLAAGLAWTRSPRRVQLHGLDLAGGDLAWLRELPHVGTVADRTQPELVRRVVAELASALDRREAARPDRPTALFLLVDGWATLEAEFGDLVPAVTALAHRGLAAGIHLLVTTTRWLDLPAPVRDLVTTRVELRLGDPADSQIGAQAAAAVPADRPGHGLSPTGAPVLTAHPATPDQITAFVQAVRTAWPGPGTPAVRLLPTVLPYRPPTPASGPDALRLPIGLAEAGPAPASVDLDADPHLLVVGDAGCGKTAFLRMLAAGLGDRWPAARLTTLPLRSATDAEIAERIAALADRLAARRAAGRSSADRSSADRRLEPGREDPRLVLLVDDHDLVADPGDDPLLPLLPYLPRARELRFHLVLSRRCGGAARAMYGPVLQRLRELSTGGLMMSGDPAEGPVLGGVRPEPLPPGRARLVGRPPDTRLVHLYYLPEQ